MPYSVHIGILTCITQNNNNNNLLRLLNFIRLLCDISFNL